MIRFAILGAGGIAHVMATTIILMNKAGNDSVKLCAVASRSIDKSKAFAREFNIQKAYGSYEELYNDSEIDLVYIATPHSFHFEQSRQCLLHGKHVLCEKPFTVNAKEAKALFDLSREKNLYICEGIWTRYQPMRRIINDTLNSGIIGDAHLITANLGYNIVKNERLVKPELAGGALLDVGIYTLTFADMIFGEPKGVDSSCIKNAEGVDMSNSVTLTYEDPSKMAVLCSSALCISDRFGMIHGTKGIMMIDNINNPKSITVFNDSYEIVKTLSAPAQLTGFEYEVMESVNCIEAGKIESDSMPYEKTLKMMNLMDSIRAQLGIKYPFE